LLVEGSLGSVGALGKYGIGLALSAVLMGVYFGFRNVFQSGKCERDRAHNFRLTVVTRALGRVFSHHIVLEEDRATCNGAILSRAVESSGVAFFDLLGIHAPC
jgi:hypothetical protein